MSDDVSLFGPEMRKPGLISLVAGFTLGFMAIQAQRIQTGAAVPWWLGFPYGALAAVFLYGISYRNRKKRAELS